MGLHYSVVTAVNKIRREDFAKDCSCRVLLNMGADPFCVTADGFTSFDLSRQSGNLFVSQLLEADERGRSGECCSCLRTLLHCGEGYKSKRATKKGEEAIAQALQLTTKLFKGGGCSWMLRGETDVRTEETSSLILDSICKKKRVNLLKAGIVL
eukprot:GDKK01023483.1.p1 GENE.GDKK01023483.1~~GDKK01023483.1.p1  ORF type:complete len:154 (+),score=27.69 GDKK01023483.1:1-462(+)